LSTDYRALIISDLQIPFQHEKALQFCRAVCRDYNIPENDPTRPIFNVGDEVDQYNASFFPKDPDAQYTAKTELDVSKEILQDWYRALPYMRLAESNHGIRWKKKAVQAEIPSQMMRRYQEVIGAPPGWKWQTKWLVKTKHPFQVEHGDDWGGQLPHKNAALYNGVSTAIGHFHSLAGVEHLHTKGGQRLWGAVAGSLIDFDTYAFNYARKSKLKPIMSVLVVLNNGKDCHLVTL